MDVATLQAFRSIFLLVETVALAVAAILIQFRGPSTATVAAILSGLVLVPVWMVMVRLRASEVDKWKKRIYDNAKDEVLLKYFKYYNKTGYHIRSIRLWLDVFAPVYIAILWIGLLLLWVSFST